MNLFVPGQSWYKNLQAQGDATDGRKRKVLQKGNETAVFRRIQQMEKFSPRPTDAAVMWPQHSHHSTVL